MTHIKFTLFKKVPLSNSFKNGSHETHASAPSLSNYKTVKAKYAVSTKCEQLLPDWIVFDYFYCNLSLLLALNNKKWTF